MTDNHHPMTPPPELVYRLQDLGNLDAIELAYQAGADQELEACKEWVSWRHSRHESDELLFARRPKPPSLKEQAKFAAAVLRSPDETCSIAELQQHWHTICNALEQLND